GVTPGPNRDAGKAGFGPTTDGARLYSPCPVQLPVPMTSGLDQGVGCSCGAHAASNTIPIAITTHDAARAVN
ncbi:MAG: hypothetical protein ABIN10_05505, partial [Specibacter sp.]